MWPFNRKRIKKFKASWADIPGVLLPIRAPVLYKGRISQGILCGSTETWNQFLKRVSPGGV